MASGGGAAKQRRSSTFTLTFCETAENHKGMQMIGELAPRGLSLSELETAQAYFKSRGVASELVHLNALTEKARDADPAYVLFVPGGVRTMVDPDELYAEQAALKKDAHAFMYGRVVNKKARHNLCFADFSQAPDYADKKGTVVNFEDVPLTQTVRRELARILPDNPHYQNLLCEGNYYYDPSTTFIGFHGDVERRLVTALRLGADFNIHYQWYDHSEPVGPLFTRMLHHGDIYFMSEKAVGFDWRHSSKMTLRHAAALDFKLIAPKAKKEA